MDNLLEIIQNSWQWTGITFVKVMGENDFGNVMLEDSEGAYWRICPEELSIEKIANNREELNKISKDEEFYEDWKMSDLVSLATDTLGDLEEGRKYCLKIPGVLGGVYDETNIATIAFKELIELSGKVANEIMDLPDGTQIEFKFVD